MLRWGKPQPMPVSVQALVELVLALCRGLMKSDAGGQRFYMRLAAKLRAGVCA
jgi:hypothetical protein